MIHFTCDMCGKDMQVEDKDRYIVHIEIRPADDPWELTEEDIHEDNLEKVSELLRDEEASAETLFEELLPVRSRYDLCPACRKQFMKNPLHRQAAPDFNFSKN